MDALVRSVTDLFAAIFGMLGVVGKPRRRANIRDNLQLLDELAEHADFGRGSWPHQALLHRVALDVARLAGVPIGKRKIPWRTVILAFLIGAPCGYWAFKLDQHGFRLLSLIPGVFAAFMALAILGMLFGSAEDSTDESEDSDAATGVMQPRGLTSPPESQPANPEP